MHGGNAVPYSARVPGEARCGEGNALGRDCAAPRRRARSACGRRRNLDAAGRVGFPGGRPSYVKLLERLLRGSTERRDPGEFNQVSKPVVILVEEQLNRITVETISLSSLSHWIRCFLLTRVQGLAPAGAPGGIRTPNPQIRSLMLYPVELRALGLMDTRT